MVDLWYLYWKVFSVYVSVDVPRYLKGFVFLGPEEKLEVLDNIEHFHADNAEPKDKNNITRILRVLLLYKVERILAKLVAKVAIRYVVLLALLFSPCEIVSADRRARLIHPGVRPSITQTTYVAGL